MRRLALAIACLTASLSCTDVIRLRVDDTTRPEIVGTAPAPDEAGVAPTTAVRIFFSEPIDPGTLSSAFTLVTTGQESVPFSIETSSGNATVILRTVSPLALLASFEVDVADTVADPAGNTLSMSHRWTFSTRDGEWTEPEIVETNNSGDATWVRVSSSTAQTTVSWLQESGTQYAAWATRREADEWTSPALIDERSGIFTVGELATNDKGDAAFIWTWGQPSGGNNIRAAVLRNGAWQPSEAIESLSATSYDDPKIVLDSAGNATAVWDHSTGSSFELMWNRYEVGSGWSSAAVLGTAGGGAVYYPDLALLNGSDVLVVFWRLGGPAEGLWWRQYSSGTWSAPEAVMLGNTPYPVLSINASGNGFVVFLEQVGVRQDVWAARFTSGSWSGLAKLEMDDAGSAFNPDVATNDRGEAIAVWSQEDANARRDIWAARFVPGDGWQSPELLDIEDGNAYSPHVAVDARGNGIVVWSQRDAASESVWARRYVAASGWMGATPLDVVGEPARSPDVDVHSDGSVTVVWTQSDGIRMNVVSSRFE